MEYNNRKPIKARITYEVNEYQDSESQEFNYYEYDDGYDNQTPSENNTFELEYTLPESNDEFIEALERWTDFIPDEITKDAFEEGFGLIQYDEEYDENDDMAEFVASPNHDDNINTSIPQKIVIYFDDGSEEDITITNQEDTLRRVFDLLKGK